MTREEAIRIIRKMLACTDLSVRANLKADMVDACNMAIKALSQEPCDECKYKTFTELYFHTDPEMAEQEPCEKQIKIGTKVRTTKDKDFACEKVFPVGTIGIVERIYKGDKLPYKIVANNDYFYYSRDMFEIIEDVEPCTDAERREWE